MAETEHQRAGIQRLAWPSSDTQVPSTKLLLCRGMSSSSESGFESGSSDLSDELGSSQPSTADSTESTASECLEYALLLCVISNIQIL